MATSSLEKVFPPAPAAGLPTAAFEERAEEDEDGIVEMSSEQEEKTVVDLRTTKEELLRSRDGETKPEKWYLVNTSRGVLCVAKPAAAARGGGARLRRGTPE